ncbi:MULTISPECIES: 16S rRNA (cytidine(1402)-2'-O)-methyltransferase [unclassified Mycoplasma]|uniref:16S rRNA (cytidine(1402)-2'-O)-methyltransferase n=1 Tax=unclassified Mycoplasma TaxID=2683645 RepID=UPI00211C0B1A|nr:MULTISPECIES: 16S rRNA (cytidine(1402)-2'-O)-methyltransferase [unclassified Mycoplasma]UUM19714.1 16S rRNA (cytidine(1402)-2'-O)-methyltransferase [Mycoplasma sp. 1578d]UUM24697.1 16S rRNA (cytidine(1402)-2'-O)-methyltransferase [Mycoplasma sp. 3686d]
MSKLYIVGTPIGNLQDMTLRAIQTLKNSDVIACEDTRVTAKLLEYFDIKEKKLITYNNFTEKNSAKGIIELLKSQKIVSLVSDAGMPVVSDPGFEVIKLCREQNIDFEIIPGVNAAITAFVGSNFSNTFSFLGFLKDKSSQRIIQLNSLTLGTYIFYVSPHKLEASLEDINQVFQGNERVCLVKELTKIHETWYYGNASQILHELKLNNTIKGEFTLVLNLTKSKNVKVNKYPNRNKMP